MLYVPATVEEGLHMQVHEDGEDLLVGEAVEARLVGPLEAAEKWSTCNKFFIN